MKYLLKIELGALSKEQAEATLNQLFSQFGIKASLEESDERFGPFD